MGRPTLASDDDQLERVVHKRNIVCSVRFLEALRFNHGEPYEPSDLDQGEPTPEPEEQGEPAQLTTETIAELPIIHISQNKVEQIKRIVCHRFSISKHNIESASRKQGLCLPRQIGMHLARKHTNHSLMEIARRFGGRDHSTVHHAFRKIERMAAADAKLAMQLAELHAEIPA